MKAYIGYIRVSTVKQGTTGVSLQEQRDAISRYAERNQFHISTWLEEKETVRSHISDTYAFPPSNKEQQGCRFRSSATPFRGMPSAINSTSRHGLKKWRPSDLIYRIHTRFHRQTRNNRGVASGAARRHFAVCRAQSIPHLDMA